MNYEYVLIAGVVIVAGLLLYIGINKFLKNKTVNHEVVSSIDIETLISALGGQKNIEDVSSSPSKVTVTLKNLESIDLKTIQSLGASGIVEGKSSLSMIFGKQSPFIEQDLKTRL